MAAPIRPFLKWAGGKRQLLPELRRFYPAAPGRYFEPFLGSGAVFFDLAASGAVSRAVLSDHNADLVGCYLRVRDDLPRVVAALERLAAGHARGGAAFYLEVRDGRFNPLRVRWRRAGGQPEAYTPNLAAMLLYLNRTGYNGLFRLNASGGFNVPPGRYVRPRIVDRPLLAAASEILRRPGVELRHARFDEMLADARRGDFAYFDPPYAPLSATASFRHYTAGGFSDADQARLREVLVALARRGVGVVLSNSTAPSIVRLYEGDRASAAAGLKTWRVPARRSINSRARGRGPIDELVVSNLEPRGWPARTPRDAA